MENTLITGEISFWRITKLEMIHGGCISTGELSYARWILQLGMTVLSPVYISSLPIFPAFLVSCH